ncbi:type I polyketide synthase [Streptomyces goshikiensis]|uniref:type I polyketide synthase n=1 Tax=Streptomyces goshikiensis TaxID=1942 RepID=UPI0035EA435F
MAPKNGAQRSSDIAVVGMSCRLPGAPGIDEFWELLTSGGSAIERRADGTWRGSLEGAADFDAAFFDMSPRQAAAADPQQRLMLELGWTALEDAGIVPGSLAGTDTGVFVGIAADDYAALLHRSETPVSGHTATGLSRGMAANRLSYLLGLRGPSLAVDSAQSSSLVAVHLACESLRRGESDLAIVGGVSLILAENSTAGMELMGALSPDGRCYTFDARANGYVRGEGGACVVLKPLDRALADGDRVHCVIRGSAVNNDGGGSTLTTPHREAQEAVLRAAYERSGVGPDQVSYVELHGTGTPAGDPIEAAALGAVLGTARGRSTPLSVGSAKTNVGHLEAAAGLVGFVKAALCVREGVVPPSLNHATPNPAIPMDRLNLRVPTRLGTWPQPDEQATGRLRLAGVSSFGMGGTNAHVVVEEAPVPEEGEFVGDAPLAVVPVVVSGRSAGVVAELASRMGGVAGSGRLVDVGWSSVVSRSVFEHRSVVLAENATELNTGLDALAAGVVSPGVVSGVVSGEGGRSVFVFPGAGAKWSGMAARLWAESVVFAESMARCEAAFEGLVDWRLADVLCDEAALEREDVAQPASFAVMVSLAELWRSLGVVPDAVVGHSQGEIAAAVVAGGLSLEDGARAVVFRSRVAEEVLSGGGIASVRLSRAEVEERLAGGGGGLSVAVVNAPSSTVVAGELGELERFVAACEAEGVRARRLEFGYASHSVFVEPARGRLLEALADVRPVSGEIPFYSTVEAAVIDTASLDAGYWFGNLRRPVRFQETVEQLLADGFRVFVECGAHPVLTAAVQETAESVGRQVCAVGSLRREEGGLRRFLTSVAEAFVQGVEVSWPALFDGTGARTVDLPTYPFQRQHYWAQASPAGSGSSAAARFGMTWEEHPLLSGALPLAESGELLLVGRISPASHSWIADHTVAGTALLPGTAFVGMALHAAAVVGCAGVEELSIEAPLPVHGGIRLQVVIDEPDSSDRRRVSVFARPEAEDGHTGRWTRHATGVLTPAAAPDPGRPQWSREAWPPSGSVRAEGAELYDRFSALGYEYGEVFAGVEAVWLREGEVFAEVRLPAGAAPDAERFGVHPGLLDAALQPWLLGDFLSRPDDGSVLLPFAWRGITLYATGADALRVRLGPAGEGAMSLEAVDLAGAPVLSMDALVLRPLAQDRLVELVGGTTSAPLYRVDWQRSPIANTAPSATGLFGSFPSGATRRWVVVGQGGAAARYATADPGTGCVGVFPDLDALRTALDSGAERPDIVLADFGARPGTAAPHGTALADGVRDTARRGLALVQGWLSDERFAAARLAVLTEHAVATEADERQVDLAGSALWGLMRSAQTEHPDRFVLVEHDGQDASYQALPAALDSGIPQLALRSGKVRTPGLAVLPTPGDGLTATGTGFDPEGTVLVTGATGTLGSLLARHLVTAHGVRHLLLLSRSGRDAGRAAELERELTGLGAEFQLLSCDATDRVALQEALATVPAAHPLTAVIHTAGVLDDGVVEALTPERLDRVLRPKADAALNLHELTAGMPLKAFVLYSGSVGLLGGAGQANYAAANAFLDGLAQYRHAQGLPAVSLAWGLWSAASTFTGHLGEVDLRRMERSGIAPLTNEQGLELLDRALGAAAGADAPQICAMRLDTAALRRQAAEHGPASVPLLLRTLAAPAVRRGAARTGRGARAASAVTDVPSRAQDLRERLAGLDAAGRRDELLAVAQAQLADVLGFTDKTAVDPVRSFREIGLDSLTAVELRNRLDAVTGLRLPSALVFDHPNLDALAGHLAELLMAEGKDDAGAAALSGIDALDRAVRGMAADDTRRDAVRRRLTELLAVVGHAPRDGDRSTRTAAGTGSHGVQAGPDLLGQLDSASDDDLFAFIEDQL